MFPLGTYLLWLRTAVSDDVDAASLCSVVAAHSLCWVLTVVCWCRLLRCGVAAGRREGEFLITLLMTSVVILIMNDNVELSTSGSTQSTMRKLRLKNTGSRNRTVYLFWQIWINFIIIRLVCNCCVLKTRLSSVIFSLYTSVIELCRRKEFAHSILFVCFCFKLKSMR